MEHIWAVYAILASVLWGAAYVFDDKLMQAGFTPAVIIIVHSFCNLVVFGLYLFLSNQLKSQLSFAYHSDHRLMFVVTILFSMAAGLMILLSIASKNATMAGFIEISYPFFTALFAWWLFRDIQLNPYTLLGGVIMAAGACLVIAKS